MQWPSGIAGAKVTQRFALSSSWVWASLALACRAACPWAPRQQLPHLCHLMGHLASFKGTVGAVSPGYRLLFPSPPPRLPLSLVDGPPLGILTTWHSSFAQVISSGP